LLIPLACSRFGHLQRLYRKEKLLSGRNPAAAQYTIFFTCRRPMADMSDQSIHYFWGAEDKHIETRPPLVPLLLLWMHKFLTQVPVSFTF
ncbi:MAG: hypothetical protein ACLTAF_14235, partial [Blautia coccoides]